MLIGTYSNDVLTLILFGCAVSAFNQHDYTVQDDYAVLDYYNKKYVEYFHIRNVRPNRTYNGYWLDVHTLIDLDQGYKVNTKAFKFINNQPTHLIFQLDVKMCEAVDKNSFGIRDIFNMGNITHCPIKKGYYYLNAFRLPQERLPPLVPAGRYRLQLSAMYYKSTIAKASFYGTVVYKMKYWRD